MSDKLAQYKVLRDVACSRIADIHAIACISSTAPQNLIEFKLRYLKLEPLYKEFDTYHAKLIQQLIVDKKLESLEAEDKIRLECDKLYYNIKTIYVDEIERTEQATPPTQTDVKKPQSKASSQVRLPKLNLPIFSGNYKEWSNFIDLYTTLIHKNDLLSDIEKYQYLIGTLSNEPLALIRGIPLSEDNYAIAFQTLTERYQNKRLLATHYYNEIQNFPRLTSDSVNELRMLINTFSENIAALRNLKFPVDHWDFILFNVLLSKLDAATRKRFELQVTGHDVPSYKELKDFLSFQCQALETVSTEKMFKPQPSSSKSANYGNYAKHKELSSFMINTHRNDNSPVCTLCKSAHLVYKCPHLENKTPFERHALVKENSLCYNCLGTHSLRTCQSKSVCKVCKNKHHSLLHLEGNRPTANPQAANSAKSELPPPQVNNAASYVAAMNLNAPRNALTANVSCYESVLLATAEIEIMDAWGNFQRIRVLLDSASQANFITSERARSLGLSIRKMSIPIQGLGETSVANTSKGISNCSIRPRNELEPVFSVDVVAMSPLCANMPSSELSYENWSHIENLKLADPNFHKVGKIDMLLGADIYPFIVRDGCIQGQTGEPSALNTIFGWVLMGKVNYQIRVNPSIRSFLLTAQDSSLETSLKQFWELEKIPEYELLKSPEDIECETIFSNSYYIQNNRFVVQLPFKNSFEPEFVGSREQALRRFHYLENRLNKDVSLKNSYAEFMKDYLTAGHMSIAPRSLENSRVYYIPHHCVIKPESTTTKLRVVFDASAKDSNGISLNSTLLTGSKLQKDITLLLLQFRFHEIALTADIKQMYRQIVIHPKHRDYQRILWRFSSNEPVQEYILNTVTYGVSSAPYLAIRTLQQLAENNATEFPLASRILRSQFYVDDLIYSCASAQTALTLQTELDALLEKGGFELRKWASNKPQILSNIAPERCQSGISLDLEKDSFIKILGLQWFPQDDWFSYNVRCAENSCTKRKILSELARIFDPLGFLSPLTFWAKHLMQQLWLLGLDWDLSPPENIITLWAQFKSEIALLANIKIPRCIAANISIEIHAFCDASEKGYACVVYFRVVDTLKNVRISLVTAKSKVAPLKTISIPRLELCGATLLADLIASIQPSLKELNVETIYAWTDSTVTLAWIKSSPHRWKTFVSNRVSHIQEVLSPASWHYVSTHDNPADCASRGLLPSSLVEHPLWWNGPTWLSHPKSTWPNADQLLELTPSECNSHVEEKKLTLLALSSTDKIKSLLEKFSSLRKIQRIIAYCIRFSHNLQPQNDKKFGPLSLIELNASLRILVRLVQNDVFSEDIEKLAQGQPCSKALRRLNPFVDERGLLRVGGRLTNSSLDYDCKFPLLLPRNHRLTELIIEQFHKDNMHSGPQSLHFLIVQQFWILSAKRAIRSVLSRCYRCFRVNPVPCEPLMGNLPASRISQVKPFSVIGIDYAGPFKVTMLKSRGAKANKAYFCVFVCFATKAIHLEIVSDLSTEACLAALRRFIARRGRVSIIHSDQGTNFVGASNYLLEIMKNAAETEGIEWKFNPPSAPHFGGLWEAGVKSVKTHLIRVIGEQTLTFEEMYTVLVQIEAVLNSRPLSALSPDPQDLTALTPGHFLTLEPLTALPDPNIDCNVNRLSRWQLLQRLHQDFWKRWHLEYLHTLNQRNKWTVATSTLPVGTLVVIKNELSPPLQWKLGRVISLHPGSDGICRVATLRTSRGELQRPLTKLCPLPLQ